MTFRAAQLSAKTVANYFLLNHWTEPNSVKISEIRELRDSLTVIDFYLQKKREAIEAKLLGETHEYQRQIHDGNVGYNVSGDGAWHDYELSIDEEDGQLVEAVDAQSSCGETSCMQCG